MIIDLISNQLKQGKKFIFFIGFKTIAEAIAFLTPLLIAKLLNPELFGSFSLFKMILFFGIAVFLGPLMAPLNIESNKEYSKTKKSNKTFTSALIYSFCSVSIFLLIYLFFGKELISFAGLNYDEFKYVFLLAFFGLSIKSFLSTFFMSQDNKKANVFVDLSYSLVLILYIFVIFYFKVFNLYNIFLGFFISSLTILFFSFFLIDYKRIFPLSFSLNNLKTLSHFSFWVVLGGTSSYFINWGDNLVLRYLVSLKEIGIYNLAYQIFKGFIMISFMINTYFTPFISQNIKNKGKIVDYIKYKRKTILRIIIPLIIIFGLFLGILVRLFFDTAYLPSINVFRILLPGILIAFYLSFYIPIFLSTKNYKIICIFLSGQVLLNLLLDIILVPFMGIYGAALATTMTYIIYAIFTENKIRKIMKTYYLNKP